MKVRALVIEDDDVARKVLVEALHKGGMDVVDVDSVETARPLLDDNVWVLFLDLHLPGVSGGVFLTEVRDAFPELPVVVVTADRSLDQAVELMRNGASDYVIKPFTDPQIEAVMRRAVAQAQLRREVYRLRRELDRKEGLDGIVGKSLAMRTVFDRIRKAAPSNISVTFLGDSGTGKELLARALHQESRRQNGPFVALNCAAMPRDLLESQLFGHRKGSFTGAIDDQQGHFVQADGGTLFLDEIGEMDPALQAKLLRTLQEGTVRPLGAEEETKVDVRIVAATNRDLDELVESGTFREDLYYRVVAFPIMVPALRARPTDITELAYTFLRNHRSEAGKPTIERIGPRAMDALQSYSWPGNVRQLDNTIYQAILMTTDPSTITLEALPPEIKTASGSSLRVHTNGAGKRGTASNFHDPATGHLLPLRAIEEEAFRMALEEHGGNTTQAAKALGVARATFYRRLKPTS